MLDTMRSEKNDNEKERNKQRCVCLSSQIQMFCWSTLEFILNNTLQPTNTTTKNYNIQPSHSVLPSQSPPSKTNTYESNFSPD